MKHSNITVVFLAALIFLSAFVVSSTNAQTANDANARSSIENETKWITAAEKNSVRDLDASFRLITDYAERGLYYSRLNELNSTLSDLRSALKHYLEIRDKAGKDKSYTDKEREVYTLLSYVSDSLFKTPPSMPDAYDFRGAMHFAFWSMSPATADLDKAIAMGSKDPETYRLRGLIFYIDEKSDQGIACVNKGLLISPKHRGLLNGRVDLYLQAGKYLLAAADLTTKLASDPNNATDLGLRAYAYREAGEIDKGLIDYTQVIKLTPKDPQAYVYRASAFFNGKNDLALAMTDVNKALEIDPRSLSAHMTLGYMYKKTNKKSQAIASYRKVLEIDPTNEFARKALIELGEKP